MPLIHRDARIELTPGKTLFDYADVLQVRVPTSCGRTGTCHECIVEIARGMEALHPRTEPEGFLHLDYRLACQARILDPDAEIAFEVLARPRQIVSTGIRRPVTLDPLTVRVGDEVHRGGRRIDEYRGAIYGLAVDVGTTTIVVNLVDLETGKVLHTSGLENPQRFGGSDVMHRISYDAGEFRGELHKAVTNALNAEIRAMSRQLRFVRRLIYEIVVVGNATMRDLFFGLDVQSIGETPYKSTTELAMLAGERETTSLYVAPRDLNLFVNTAGIVYGAPLIASHVGADVVADLLAIGMDELDDTNDVSMLVDIGTNTEVVVGNRHRLLGASCPAGPAFEGGFVTFGMPGYDGAIESIRLDNGHVDFRVIGGGQPEGICGSGLIDLIAELVRTGRMNELGVFRAGGSQVVVVPERGITFSRADASQLAQAKAANYCGQAIVLRAHGVRPEQIRRVYLAGGFASYIDIANAMAIGLIPRLPVEKFVKVGNASLEGATFMLVSQAKRRAAEVLARRIQHVELETTPDFFELFVEGCQFKPLELLAPQQPEPAIDYT